MLLITPHWCLRWIIKPSDVSRLALTIKGRSYQCRLQLILPSPQRHLLLEADATYAIIGNNAVHEPRAPTLTGCFAKVVGTWTTNQQAHAKTPRVRPVNMTCLAAGVQKRPPVNTKSGQALVKSSYVLHHHMHRPAKRGTQPTAKRVTFPKLSDLPTLCVCWF